MLLLGRVHDQDPRPDSCAHAGTRGAPGASFLRMEGSHQQHGNRHNDCDCKRKKYCSHHVVRKNIDGHDFLLISFLTPISLERSLTSVKATAWSTHTKGQDFGPTQQTPGRVPVERVELMTERFAMAYRLWFAYASVRRKSEQNSSHLTRQMSAVPKRLNCCGAAVSRSRGKADISPASECQLSE
jgi:hypothetical protein